MPNENYFHEASGTVRFWVLVDGQHKGGSVSSQALHYRYKPAGRNEDPMETFEDNRAEIEAAARRRFAEGALEPVMLREHDLRVQATKGAS
jgi:hypothetical protein